MLVKGATALFTCAIFATGFQEIKDQFNPFSHKVDTLEKIRQSPDRQYVAKLLYRENRAMTYGFYHVTIESSQTNSKPFDLVEVAAEGLRDIRWKGRRVLIVSYDATKYKDGDDDTMFVKNLQSWQDVKILYQKAQ